MRGIYKNCYKKIENLSWVQLVRDNTQYAFSTFSVDRDQFTS